MKKKKHLNRGILFVYAFLVVNCASEPEAATTSVDDAAMANSGIRESVCATMSGIACHPVTLPEVYVPTQEWTKALWVRFMQNFYDKRVVDLDCSSYESQPSRAASQPRLRGLVFEAQNTPYGSGPHRYGCSEVDQFGPQVPGLSDRDHMPNEIKALCQQVRPKSSRGKSPKVLHEVFCDVVMGRTGMSK